MQQLSVAAFNPITHYCKVPTGCSRPSERSPARLTLLQAAQEPAHGATRLGDVSARLATAAA